MSHSLRPIIDGGKLVVFAPFQLPEVCLLSGRGDNLVPCKQAFTVHSPLAGVAGIFGPGAHVAADMLTRRTVTLRYFLSRRELNAKKSWLTFNWLIFATTFIALATGIMSDFIWMITVVAPACAISSVFLYYTKVRFLEIEIADEYHAEVSGIPDHVMQVIAPTDRSEDAPS